MSNYLSNEAFQSYFDGFTNDAFNINLLPEYDVSVDRDSFERWRRGEPISDYETNSPYQQTLRGYRQQGKTVRRLKVIDGELTDYQRNGLEWWWPNNDAAGEETRVLDVSRLSVELPPNDFWLLDYRTVLIMDYDQDFHWLGARVFDRDIKPYLEWAERLWALGTSWRNIAQTKA